MVALSSPSADALYHPPHLAESSSVRPAWSHKCTRLSASDAALPQVSKARAHVQQPCSCCTRGTADRLFSAYVRLCCRACTHSGILSSCCVSVAMCRGATMCANCGQMVIILLAACTNDVRRRKRLGCIRLRCFAAVLVSPIGV